MRVFLRTWLGVAIYSLPLLVLLLVPQLMRSRAGSEQLLFIGIALLLVLLVACTYVSPIASAWLAPHPPDWTRRTAIANTRAVWRTRRTDAVLALAGLIVVYGIGQIAGFGLAEVLPHVTDNPDFVDGGTESRWNIHYGPYVVQAVLIYAFTTAGLAWYATRIRRAAATAPNVAETRTG